MPLPKTPTRKRVHRHGTVRQQLQEARKQTFSGQDEFRPDFQSQVRPAASETEKRTAEEVQEVFLAFDGKHKLTLKLSSFGQRDIVRPDFVFGVG